MQPPPRAEDGGFMQRLLPLLPVAATDDRSRLQLLSLLEARLAQVSLVPHQQQPQQQLQQQQELAALRQLVATERAKVAEDACALLGPPPCPPPADAAAENPPPLLTPEALPNGCLLVSSEGSHGVQELLASLLPKRGPLPPPAEVVVVTTTPAPRPQRTRAGQQAPPAQPHLQHQQQQPHRQQQQQHQHQHQQQRPSSSGAPFQRQTRTAGAGGPATDQALARIQSGQHQYQYQQPPASAQNGPYLRSTAPPRMQPQQPSPQWPSGSHPGQAQSYASRFATAGELRSQRQQQQPPRRKRPLGDGGDGNPYTDGPPPPAQRGGNSVGGERRWRYGEDGEGGGGRWFGGQEGEDEEDEQQQHYREQQAGFNPRVMKKYVPPVKGANSDSGASSAGIKGMVKRAFAGPAGGPQKRKAAGGGGSGGEEGGESKELPEELKGCDPALVGRIEQEIIDRGDPVSFDDISGLRFQKDAVVELVCWPLERPDLFTGLRALPKGLLLFGPPGTGKTLIGKAISSQSGATFFSISASSLTSKWIGEGEKMVRTLFKVAAYYQPTIIFIDEVDSLLCQRTSDENEATRRLKTEFLVQLDGCGSSAEDRILVVGATNRPDELDEAARRRFVKRLYIPLPDAEARSALVTLLLRKNSHALTEAEIQAVVGRTEGFSGADVKSLCTEAAMGPIRDLASKGSAGLSSLQAADVPPITFRHFLDALASVRPSVGDKELGKLMAWNEQFGTYPRCHQQQQEDKVNQPAATTTGTKAADSSV